MNAPEKYTILIVDDQPENLSVLTTLLQGSYLVRAARSGAQALRVAASDPRPDLILLDIMMPEMDGYAVLTALRQQPATAAIPVVFLTALAADEDEKKGLELGAADYITKPIKPALVLARVANHLELKHARDRLAEQNAQLEHLVAKRTEALNQALSEVEAAHAGLKKTYFDTLRAIGDLANLRGGNIAKHSRRVADLARQVAVRMGLPASEVQDVFIAGLLHDVGKIGFPEPLLMKPVTTMNREDMETYRHHPVAGAEIIGGISALSRIAEVIRHHHEHYDGSGFPTGLSALNIPLGARIICAVSDFEDLRAGAFTQRPQSAKLACESLLQESGARYDPEVLEVLEPILSAEGKFEIDELPMATRNLREGLRLTRDVLHPKGFVLLSSGSVLTQRLIGQLFALEQQTGTALRLHVQRKSGQS